MQETCCNHEPDKPVGFISQVHGGQRTTSGGGGVGVEQPVGRERSKQLANQFFFCVCCNYTLANVIAVEKPLDDLLTQKKIKASKLATTFALMNDISLSCVMSCFFFVCFFFARGHST